MFKSGEKRGQSNLISVVLLTLIMVTLVAITYMWGMPLVEKQKDTVKVSDAEKFMKELDDKIQNVIKNGGTQIIDNPKLPGTLKMIDNGINDAIELKFETTGTNIAIGQEIYLRGSEIGEIPLGEESGVIKVISNNVNDKKYEVNMTLYYRNVTGSKNIYTTDIYGLGRDMISGEKHRIIITEGEETTGPVGERDGKEIYVTKINLRFE